MVNSEICGTKPSGVPLTDAYKKALEIVKHQIMLPTTSQLLLDEPARTSREGCNVLRKPSDNVDLLVEPHRRDITCSAHLHHDVVVA